MNTEEFTHLQKNLANSRAPFLAIFASAKLSPLNSIQALVPCSYVANNDPTGKSGSHCSLFFSRPKGLESMIVLEDNLVNSAFHFQSLCKYLIIPNKSRPWETYSVVMICIYILYHRANNYALHSICKNSQSFHIIIHLKLFLHLFINDTKDETWNEWLHA